MVLKKKKQKIWFSSNQMVNNRYYQFKYPKTRDHFSNSMVVPYSTIFSKFDMKSRFGQIQIAEKRPL